MHSIEQAREALRLYDLYDQMPADRGGKNGPKGRAYQAFLDAKTKALSPTPVDGVGAEPRVKLLEWEERSGAFYADTALGEACIDEAGEGFYVIENGRKHAGFVTVEDAQAFVQSNHALWVSDWLETSALANPEAEARLRERVAELERERDEARADYEWMHDNRNKWQDATTRERNRAEAAEARIAQAEGGPAVTEAEIKAFRAKYREIFPRSHPDRQTIIELLTASKRAVNAASAAFKAALHPQSAAGEEGKP